MLKTYPTAEKFKSVVLSKVPKIIRENSIERYYFQKAGALIAFAKQPSASCFGDAYETMMTSLLSRLESIQLLITQLDHHRIELLISVLNCYL